MTDELDPWDNLVPEGVKPAFYAYKYRHFIQKYWVEAQVRIGIGFPSIIVTGRTGSGKSVLVSHYHGEANNLDWKVPGTSTDVEIKPITIGDWTKIVAVIPGQNNAERAKSLDDALNKTDGLEGVIHVVDWGYTSVRSSEMEKDRIENKGFDSVEKVREQNIYEELRDFESILDKVSMAKANGRGPSWLLIAVNKIDLFEDTVDEAARHYHPSYSGEFSKILASFYKSVGEHNIRVDCIPVCSMPEPFKWNKQTVKSQIDSSTRLRNYLRAFVDRVAALQNGSS